MKQIDDQLSNSSKSSTKTKRNRKPAEWKIKENDELIKQIKKSKGKINWNLVSKRMQKKFHEDERFNVKACKDRYNHYLKEGLNLKEFTDQEIQTLIQLTKEYKNQWSIISKFMNNRTEQSVKNKFYGMVRKVLRKLYQIVTQQRNSSDITNKIKPHILAKFLSGNEDDESLTSQEKQIRIIAQDLVFSNLNINKQSQLNPQDKDKLFIILEFMNQENEKYLLEEKRVSNKPQINKDDYTGYYSIKQLQCQQNITNFQWNEINNNFRSQNLPLEQPPSTSRQQSSIVSGFSNFQSSSFAPSNYIVSFIVPYYSNGLPSFSIPQNSQN